VTAVAQDGQTAPSGVGTAASSGSRRGVLAVGAGLGVFGLSTYAYLGLAGQALGDERFAPLGVLWSVLNAVGIGLFLPFEQEIGRRTAERRARGEGNAPVARQGTLAAAALVGAVALVALVTAGPVAGRLFTGELGLVALLVLAVAGMAVAYVVRGLLAGTGRFPSYGAQLAVDGLLRVAGAGLLAVNGVTDVRPYAAVLALSPVLAVLVTTLRPRGLVVHGPPQQVSRAAAALATLVVASVLSQVLANVGPVIVQLLASAEEAAAAGRFTSALVIARVPLFLFAAVQAVLLPGLAALASAGESAGFRRRLRLVVTGTGAIGGLGTLAVLAVGPELVRALFGPGFVVDREVITLIAASGALFMLAQVAAQALLALGADRTVVLGWASGLVALLLVCLVPLPAVERAAWALVVGSGAAAGVLGAVLAVRMRAWEGRSGG
jgi:O-antigen/teichoic acid export membrane protein